MFFHSHSHTSTHTHTHTKVHTEKAGYLQQKNGKCTARKTQQTQREVKQLKVSELKEQ